VHIGVLGAGQLGRMLALAGYPLGHRFTFLDPTPEGPASQLAPQIVAAYDDPQALARLSEADVVTYEFENVPDAAATAIAQSTRLCPNSTALRTAQDRLLEKTQFEQLGIATAAFANVTEPAELSAALGRIGVPSILKTRRFGYDGKGQRVLRSPADAEPAWTELGAAPLIYEEFVPFDYEVSIIGARSRRGEIAVYPLNRNYHADGILRLTVAPWPAPRLQRVAARSLRRVLEAFHYVGVLAIEFFVRDARLIANEMAPRVHNSGHWTIEGAATSQFENHVRAIAGMPLGSTRALGHAAMINLIGEMPPRQALLAEAGLHLHDYGKEPRPGRKLGHCTIVEPTAQARHNRSKALLRRLYPHLGIKP